MHLPPWDARCPNNKGANMISTSATHPLSDTRRGPREMGLQDSGWVWLGSVPGKLVSLRIGFLHIPKRPGDATPRHPIADTAMRSRLRGLAHSVQATLAENSALHTHFKHLCKDVGL